MQVLSACYAAFDPLYVMSVSVERLFAIGFAVEGVFVLGTYRQWRKPLTLSCDHNNDAGLLHCTCSIAKPSACQSDKLGIHCTAVGHNTQPTGLLFGLQIRDAIKSLFPDRDCFPLVRPMSDEKMLAKLETIDSSQFRPEFQQVHNPYTDLTPAPLVPFVTSADSGTSLACKILSSGLHQSCAGLVDCSLDSHLLDG